MHRDGRKRPSADIELALQSQTSCIYCLVSTGRIIARLAKMKKLAYFEFFWKEVTFFYFGKTASVSPQKHFFFLLKASPSTSNLTDRS